FDSNDSKLLNSIANESAIYLENVMLFEDVHGLMMGLLHSLTSAVDAKDAYTCGHSERVALVSRHLAQQMGLADRDVEQIYMAGLLHDVGKIGVPEAILNKPGGLTEDEKEMMEQHVEIGLRIIRDVEVLCEVDPLIRYHQERWDGARVGVKYPGYFGLRGEDIPEGARILSVVDAFDAITHDRPYRAGNTVEAALEELRREAGRQFDPRLVDVLTEVLREGEWLLAEPFASAPRALRAAAG
ncbi:MAG TPA: HD-GYP domain-containing protein, partial [Thermoanaerobaculia bacterium]|nr:HD-GYP domain-containing protein [Thermoanaerobaculia bacterium]